MSCEFTQCEYGGGESAGAGLLAAQHQLQGHGSEGRGVHLQIPLHAQAVDGVQQPPRPQPRPASHLSGDHPVDPLPGFQGLVMVK